MGRVGGGCPKPSPGICLGSLLGSPQTRPSPRPHNLSGLSPAALLGLAGMGCIPVSAECLGACSWRTESAPASQHPRAGRAPDPNSPSALQCVGPSGHHELIAFISPAGRMRFSSHFTEETENRRKQANCPGAPAEMGTHILRRRRPPMTFPAGAWAGGPACPSPPGLALPPVPRPAPRRGSCSCWQAGHTSPGQAGGAEGHCPSLQPGPPERPFLAWLWWWGGGRGGGRAGRAWEGAGPTPEG